MEQKFVYVEKDTSPEVLRSWAFDLPKLSYQYSLIVVEMQGEVNATEKVLEDIKNTVFLEINKEGLEFKSKFPNQAMREAEAGKRLKLSPTYLNLTDKLIEFLKKRDTCKAKVTYYDKMFSVVKNLLYDANELKRLIILKETKQREIPNM